MNELISSWRLAFRSAAVAVIATAAVGAGCTPTAPEERATIVVTTNILGDVVENLVRDSVEIQVLMKPNADPHSFGVSAKQASALEKADLIVANGLGLEEGLESNLDNARNSGVQVLEVGEHIDPISYEQGDSQGLPDPHFWTDPQRMITATDVIMDVLQDELDPETYRQIADSAADYRTQLVELDSYVEEQVASIPAAQRKLVTNHHVFGYFADRFGFEVIGAVVPSGTTLAAPSAADLADLASAITEAQVHAIFADSSQPQRLAEVLASEAQIDVDIIALYTESLTDTGGDAPTYIAMQRYNIERITEGLVEDAG